MGNAVANAMQKLGKNWLHRLCLVSTAAYVIDKKIHAELNATHTDFISSSFTIIIILKYFNITFVKYVVKEFKLTHALLCICK